jgi:hypothetical protein
LHTASLSLKVPETISPHASTVAVVGHPLQTSLRIKHTRRWANPDSLVKAAKLADKDERIDFVYSLEAHPENWLIAGPRRAHFSAKEGETLSFPITLLPLRSGNMLLPAVEIRPRIKGDKRMSGAPDAPRVEVTGEEEELNCEVDYLDHGECVLVVPDIGSSTVGVGEMGKGAGVVWLEGVGRA